MLASHGQDYLESYSQPSKGKNALARLHETI